MTRVELKSELMNEIDNFPTEIIEEMLRWALVIKKLAIFQDSKSNVNFEERKESNSAGEALKAFLKKHENAPIDIDTSIFDSYRKSVVERKQPVEITEKVTYSVALDKAASDWNKEEDMIGWLLEHPLEVINGDAKPLTREEVYASRKD